MKVYVNEECTGCTLCCDTCPEVFEMDGDTAVAKNNNDPVPENLQDQVQEAAENCPVEAIVVE